MQNIFSMSLPGKRPLLTALALVACSLAWQTSPASGATWSAQSVPGPPPTTQTELWGVSCFTDTDCTAVGRSFAGNWGAQAQTWDGSSWSSASGVNWNPGPKNGILRGASCTAITTCVTAGFYGNSGGVPAAMAQSRNGAAWTLWNIGIPVGAGQAELHGVDCSATNSCIAVGYRKNAGDYKPWAMGYNGSSWSNTNAIIVGNAALHGVSCVSSTYCVAVGQAGSGPLAQLWTGSSWLLMSTPPTPSGYSSAILQSVDCVSTTWCLAVGYYKNSSGLWRPYADVWNGATWTSTPAIPWGANLGAQAYGVSCVSTSECWVVGDGIWSTTQPWGVLWTGTTWAIGSLPGVPTANAGSLRGVSCTATDRCKAVGWSTFGSTHVGLVESLAP